MEEGRWRNLAK